MPLVEEHELFTVCRKGCGMPGLHTEFYFTNSTECEVVCQACGCVHTWLHKDNAKERWVEV